MKFKESIRNRISTLLKEPSLDLGLQKHLAAKFQYLPDKIQNDHDNERYSKTPISRGVRT